MYPKSRGVLARDVAAIALQSHCRKKITRLSLYRENIRWLIFLIESIEILPGIISGRKIILSNSSGHFFYFSVILPRQKYFLKSPSSRKTAKPLLLLLIIFCLKAVQEKQEEKIIRDNRPAYYTTFTNSNFLCTRR